MLIFKVVASSSIHTSSIVDEVFGLITRIKHCSKQHTGINNEQLLVETVLLKRSDRAPRIGDAHKKAKQRTGHLVFCPAVM